MSKDNHSFSIAVACEVGERGALLIQHLLFLQKSTGGENWREMWVRRSAKSLANTYPYWSAKQITAISDSLEKCGFIVSKIENLNKYDRTKSYILTEKGLVLMGEKELQKCKVAFSQMENGEAETENVDLPNGEMSIKVGYNSFVSSFVEEEERQNSSSSGDKSFSLNEKNLEGRTSPALPPAPNVEVNDPAAPGATIYDHVPQPGYPSTPAAAEFQRVDIATEVEALKTDAAIREAFTLSRKIPAANYYDYLEAFRIDISGRGESYANARQLRSHFLNWAGARFEIAQKKAVEAAAKSSLPRNILQL